jgi:hypothetical protein
MSENEPDQEVSDSYYEPNPNAPEQVKRKPGRPKKNHKATGQPKGRPKSATSQKVLLRHAILDRVNTKMEVTPLEVMVLTMLDFWRKDEKLAACAIAEKAAPYIHPKLSSIQQTVEGGAKPIQIENQTKIFDELMNSIELIARTRVLAEDETKTTSTAH